MKLLASITKEYPIHLISGLGSPNNNGYSFLFEKSDGSTGYDTLWKEDISKITFHDKDNNSIIFEAKIYQINSSETYIEEELKLVKLSRSTSCFVK